MTLQGDLSKLKCEDRKFINEAIKNKCLVMLCPFYCQRFTNHFFVNKALLTIFVRYFSLFELILSLEEDIGFYWLQMPDKKCFRSSI